MEPIFLLIDFIWRLQKQCRKSCGPRSIITLSVVHMEEAFYLCQASYSRKAIPLTPRESYWYNANPFANTITCTNSSCCQDPWRRSEEKSRWSFGFSWRAPKNYIFMFLNLLFSHEPMSLHLCYRPELTAHTYFNHFWILFGVINWIVSSTAWNKKEFFYHMLQ